MTRFRNPDDLVRKIDGIIDQALIDGLHPDEIADVLASQADSVHDVAEDQGVSYE